MVGGGGTPGILFGGKYAGCNPHAYLIPLVAGVTLWGTSRVDVGGNSRAAQQPYVGTASNLTLPIKTTLINSYMV